MRLPTMPIVKGMKHHPSIADSIVSRWLKNTACLVVMLCACFAVDHARADDIADEYARRVRALAVDDIQGHLDLAKWCRSEERWQLVAQRCQHILTINPTHEPAKLLLETARAYLNRQQGDATPRSNASPADPRSPKGSSAELRKLTKDEIQKVRRAEMHRDRPERLSVRIDRAALKRFLTRINSTGSLPVSDQDFYRLPKVEQAQLMLTFGDEADHDAIQIKNDPQRLREFDRDIIPMIVQNCTTSDCHGGPGGGKFRLMPGRRLRTAQSYAVFVMLHQYEMEAGQVIDRQNPADSLLLKYFLPPGPDKAKNHPVDIRPAFPDENDRDYKKILDWILSLDLEEPDYGIDLTAAP